MPERLRRWYAAEAAKLRPLSGRQRAAYVWDYYRLWIVGFLCAAVFLGIGFRQMARTARENWLFVCFANTYADIGNGSALWRDYAAWAGYDLKAGNLVFNAQIYCDPTRENYTNRYYQQLLTLLDAGALDAVVMEPDRLQALGSTGRLMDLEDERTLAIFRRYPDRLVYCTPQDASYGKDRVAVGIDLSGTVLTAEGGAYAGDAALGVGALAPHPDQAAAFLEYLIG